MEDLPITNDHHGGKVYCHTCRHPVHASDHWCKFHGVYFHQDCYNQYEHYYGLDRPID